MRASNNHQIFFIYLNDDISRIPESDKSNYTQFFENGIIAISKISCSELDFLKKIERNQNLELIRYFDCFYLLIPLTKKEIKKLYKEFFDFISHDYENLIDVQRNQENIYNLLKITRKHFNQFNKLKILDYGCGTGLSFDIAKKFNCELFGFDICPNMRTLASQKGLIVWDEKKLMAQSANCIDGVISSYVFHFLSDDAYLKLLYKILKPKGTLVANFHKNKNRDFIDRSLKKIGFNILTMDENKNKECRHGTYVVYYKR